jgi:hypothetical protein
LIEVLVKGCKSNAADDVAEIPSPLPKWRSAGAKGDKRKLIIRADNARPHIAQLSAKFFEQNRMETGSHPPYSPDVAPSDFYLFGNVEECSACLSLESADEPLEAVQGIL